MRKVIAMMMAALMRKSARAEIQEICQNDHARASTRAWCPRGIFCKGFVPWAHDRASRDEMKSVDFDEFIKNQMVFI